MIEGICIRRAYKEVAYKCTKGELDSNNRCVLKQLLPPIIKCPEGYKYIDGLCVQLRETLCTLQGVAASVVDNIGVDSSLLPEDGFLSKSSSMVGLEQRKAHPESLTGKHFMNEGQVPFPATYGSWSGENNPRSFHQESLSLLGAEADLPNIPLLAPRREPGSEYFDMQLNPLVDHRPKESIPTSELPLFPEASYAVQSAGADGVPDKELFGTDDVYFLIDSMDLRDPGVGGLQHSQLPPAPMIGGSEGLLPPDGLRTDAVSSLLLDGSYMTKEESPVPALDSAHPASSEFTEFLGENISADAAAGFTPQLMQQPMARFLSRVVSSSPSRTMTHAAEQTRSRDGAEGEKSIENAPSNKAAFPPRRLIGESFFGPELQEHCYEVHA
ncbi:hypothetical protein CSUI_007273 [Cystoisospora suis]|uniref:Uncharacterized protein n=1 Tax=Cystoisospora suis TaxID=483139 RepID=A0A2C6KMY1_9APIC|nr:hypothetical protein CSUI_007273 [Cystoisospora suis]